MITADLANKAKQKTTLKQKIRSVVKEIYIGLVHNLFHFSTFKLVERNTNLEIDTFIPTVPIQLEEISEDNIIILGKREPERKIKLFKSRIKKSNYGLMVFVEGEIAGYAWALFSNEKSKMGIKIKHKKDEAIIKDVLVYPEFRNNKIHKHFLSVLMQRLKQRGINKVLAAYLEDNVFSEKAALSNGFKIFGKVYLIKILGVKFQIGMKI